jgi:hypothetical protein
MNNYVYSINVNEALESYGAKTCGSLDRRIERLKRFTDIKNKRYAQQIRIQNEEFFNAMDKRYPPVNRNLRVEFEEAVSEVEIPMTPRYNLRPRQENGLDLLWQAIQNGHVNPNRG